MRILLADDDENIRSALSLLLEQEPGIEVIGSAVNVSGLWDLVDSLSSTGAGCCGSSSDVEKQESEVLFLDWELPGWEPKKHLLALRAACPRLIIIALSVGPNECQVAMTAGADAFVCKSDPPDAVIRTVRDLTRYYERG